MGSAPPGFSKDCVATRVLLNLLSLLLLLLYDVGVGCKKGAREVDGTVNNSTKFEVEITCNAGADVLWRRVSMQATRISELNSR